MNARLTRRLACGAGAALRAADSANADLVGSNRVCIGNSMAPTVRFGERVLVNPQLKPRSGDVVLFASTRNEHDVLHRLVFKLPFLPYFVHRGDAVHAHVGLSRWERLIGVAPIARRRPTLADYLAGSLLVLRRTGRRLR